MGLLTPIIDQRPPEPIQPDQPPTGRAMGDASTPVSTSPGTLASASQPGRPLSCPTCHHACLWELIYADGNWRCELCEPPPSIGLVGAWMVNGEIARRSQASGPGPARAVAGDAKSQSHATTTITRGGPDPWPPGRWRGMEDLRAIQNPHACDRCGSTQFVDSRIHDGSSTRRDCARCGRFHGFSKWNGEQSCEQGNSEIPGEKLVEK